MRLIYTVMLKIRFAVYLLLASVLDAQMQYFGGKVLVPSPTLYVIYYGNWTEDQKASSRFFLTWLGGSSWFQGATSFYDASGQHIINSARYGGDIVDAGSQGNCIPDGPSLVKVVTSALDDGRLPADDLGIYNVILGTNTGLCFPTGGSGFHWGVGYKDISIQLTLSSISTGNLQGVLSHEVIEAVTDPLGGSGWHNAAGYECADVCGTYSDYSINGMSYRLADYQVVGGGCTSGASSGGGGGGGGGTSCPPGKKKRGLCQ